MGKKENKSPKVITPVDVVQKNNPLVKGIAKISEKWHERWANIERPWPVEGTMNPDVIRIMRVLVSTYKAAQKIGKKGRREKKQVELGILQLFEIEGQKLIKAANDKKDRDIENTRQTERQITLKNQVEELQKEGYQLLCMKNALRSRKQLTLNKILPVVVRGQNLEYRPWQTTDMSNIIEKLPILQDGAHSWISKLEEIMVGEQLAMGDIKRLLANLLGVHAMGDILQKAGLNQYVGTAVNDSELFCANRGRVCRALKETFLTNVHPDNILIEPLGQEENPRAYVSRAHQVWRNVTGNDPDLNQMEQSILRAKIQKGLPLPVRSKLAEVVGLGSMEKGVYTDHIAHQVVLYRKKEHDQKEHDQKEHDKDVLRKLNQIQLVDNKKINKQALVTQNQAPLEQSLLQSQLNQVQLQLFQPSSVVPVISYQESAFDQAQNWRGRFDPNFEQHSEECYDCGQFACECNSWREYGGGEY
ncbi:uncharacterized protein LOC133964835 [Platichthys flesus]|uniref:uncharacterized protein LOC133964835 n=1 Tax=Platichthys flesus TaxID=8260 RepID=UPI002DBDC4C3|nr:uncharacterized protein LOC133964835 [Platichthys flesus]